MNETNKSKTVDEVKENTQICVEKVDDANIEMNKSTHSKKNIMGILVALILLTSFSIGIVMCIFNDNHAKGTVEFCDSYTNRVLVNADIKKAKAKKDEYGNWYVEIYLTKQGRELFKDATERILKYKESDRKINIFVDYELVSSPSVDAVLDLDCIAISGGFSEGNAKQLSDMINKENKEKSRSKLMNEIGTNIDWHLSPEEITVETGEIFQINYSPAYEFSTIRPPLEMQEVINGEYVWSNELQNVQNYDNIPDDIETDLPGVETLVINKTGTYYISVRWPLGGQTNICKVNVVKDKENMIEEKEEIQNDVNTQKNSVNGNKAECEIIVKNNLPEEFKYTSSYGKWYSSCKVHKADVIQKNGSVLIQLLCEKTFDEKNGASAECYIVWKLYDDQNIVVDSGRVSKHNISVNEMFTETIHIFKDLAPKKYILEFSELQL